VVVVRGPGKSSGAFGFSLIFWLHLLHQGKRWKTTIKGTDKKRKAAPTRGFGKLSLTKRVEANSIAGRWIREEQA
jgi:hypothetical protein